MHDPTGEVYGTLTVLRYTGRKYKNGDRFVLAACTCGIERELRYPSLKSGNTKSCGCQRWLGTHGMSGSPEYQTWLAMMSRCYREGDKAYPGYGGRGISVCRRWHKFENFFADMGPSNGLIIDRRHNDKNYTKGNCRWITRAESNRNMSSNVLVLAEGEVICFAEAVRRYGSVDYRKALWRLRAGWKLQQAIGTDNPNIKLG